MWYASENEIYTHTHIQGQEVCYYNIQSNK